MKLSDLIDNVRLNESVELSSTVRSIASEIGNPVTLVYDKLNEFAQRWSETHDDMSGFRLLERTVSSRWYDSAGSDLISELHHLADQAPSQATYALRRFLRTTVSDFREVGRNVAPILIQIGKDVRSETLVRNAIAWQQQEAEYTQNLEKYEEYAQSSSKKSKNKSAVAPSMSATRDATVDKAADEKRAMRAQQQSQIENLVNSVLAKLPRGVAGEIRNAIARDPNKLHALQSQLARRGINL
jgi:NADH:ubiquinone oxidoreductase subunit